MTRTGEPEPPVQGEIQQNSADSTEIHGFEAQAPESGPEGPAEPDYSGRARGARFGLVTLAVAAMLAVAGVRIYREFSTPQAWAYWVDYYQAESLTFAPARMQDGATARMVLAIKGRIGPAASHHFETQVARLALSAGDLVLLSSPGGDLDQARLMGAEIRTRGLLTAVGELDPQGRLKPSYCASACVAAFAGGVERIDLQGSQLGVHRFSFPVSGVADPVAEAQRATGQFLGYMIDMGVSPKVVELMTTSADIQWIPPEDALALRLVTRRARG